MGDYGENKGPVGGVDPPTPTVTSASGSLYGDSSLLGGNAPLPDPDKSDSAVVKDPEFVNGQDADAKLGLYLDFDGVDVPQPIRGGLGATDPGPRTYEYEKLNPDLYAPPGTDSGDVPNAMWPLGLSHNRLGSQPGAGWARQQNQDVLPAATAMAGVDMRLAPNAYRELHWHTSAEWSLVTKGCLRVAAMNEEGKSFVDDLCAGDVWFFPPGVPHSLQAFDEGVEFLLVFNDGQFSEDETFLVSETFLRNPVSVLAKNFKTDTSAFDNIPKDQLYVSQLPIPSDPLLIHNNYRFSTELQHPRISRNRTRQDQLAYWQATNRTHTTGLCRSHIPSPEVPSRSSTLRPSPSPRASQPLLSLCSPEQSAKSTGTPPLMNGVTSSREAAE
jgi:quercetin dioxygenase-like cupin family protein